MLLVFLHIRFSVSLHPSLFRFFLSFCSKFKFKFKCISIAKLWERHTHTSTYWLQLSIWPKNNSIIFGLYSRVGLCEPILKNANVANLSARLQSKETISELFLFWIQTTNYEYKRKVPKFNCDHDNLGLTTTWLINRVLNTHSEEPNERQKWKKKHLFAQHQCNFRQLNTFYFSFTSKFHSENIEFLAFLYRIVCWSTDEVKLKWPFLLEFFNFNLIFAIYIFLFLFVNNREESGRSREMRGKNTYKWMIAWKRFCDAIKWCVLCEEIRY